MRTPLRLFALAALAPFSLPFAVAQTSGPADATPAPPPADQSAGQDQKPGATRPYTDVVTKDAVTQQGLFKVHRIDDRILFEIPANMLGREMLWQTEVAQLAQASREGYPGANAGTRIIRFTRRGGKIFMRAVDYEVRTYANGGIRTGVDENSLEPILMSFDVLTEGDDKNPAGKSVVIDVTQLFTSDPPDFTVRAILGVGGADPNRSYVDRVKAFPKNIETTSMLTFMAMPDPNPLAAQAGTGASAVSAMVHYSLDLLPETPMKPRLGDSRIGYFTQDFTEYGRAENQAVPRQYIDRFRLEKKDPNAALSEPVKPIVFYLSREVPEKWRPYIKKGIEAWRPAFEQAGFKDAIIAKDAPTGKEDPDWDPEDARYNVIRWAPSTTANAMGPSIQDPRSGENLSAHVIIWNNVVQLLEGWYFAQCAAIDPRARKLPLSDDLMGQLLQSVVTHEVGHTLGLAHNFKGSAWYTVQQLRDPRFTSEYGDSASIMDYSRFNYVAQPGDGVTRTIGMLGPYDKFAIQYGYMPIPNAVTPDDEKPALDRLLSKQVTDPRLRFGNYKYPEDPQSQTEDLSNDAVEATRLGLRNLDDIGRNILLPATTRFGEDYTRLGQMRADLLTQRFTELLHVVTNVGGVIETDYHAGRGGQVFTPVSPQMQARAVHFLVTEGLRTPGGVFEPRIVNRVEPDGVIDEATEFNQLLISTLLGEPRVRRMFDNQAMNGAKAYTVAQLVADVTNGVWSELGETTPTVDIYRRTLQRAYLRTVDRRINGATASQTDLKPLAKEQLRLLAKRIDKALPKVKDRMTALHLQECRSDIGKILNDKYASKSGGGGLSIFDLFGISGDQAPSNPDQVDCFSEAARIPLDFWPQKKTR